MSRQLCGICMCPYDEEYGSCGCTEVNQECASIEMNKPVAYWDGKHFASKDKSSLADIPLYTHPVKEQDCYGDGNVYRGIRSKDSEIQTIHFNPVKELTDEEIWLAYQTFPRTPDLRTDMITFVNGLLRKAQEK